MERLIWNITVRRCGSSIEPIEIMRLAEDATLVQGELLAGAELASTGVARKTRQMVDVIPSPSHPIRRRYRATATGTLGTKSPKLFNTTIITILILYRVITML